MDFIMTIIFINFVYLGDTVYLELGRMTKVNLSTYKVVKGNEFHDVIQKVTIG